MTPLRDTQNMGAHESISATVHGPSQHLRTRRLKGSWLSACAAVLLLSGCGISIPTDPGGTLESVTGGALRVGVTAEDRMSTDGDTPEGPLPGLANDFAHSVNANTTWVVAGEESLVEMLEKDEIDIAFGHFTKDAPWGDRVAVSRPFEAPRTDAEIVAFMQLGENAFVTKFETFIDVNGLSK